MPRYSATRERAGRLPCRWRPTNGASACGARRTPLRRRRGSSTCSINVGPRHGGGCVWHGPTSRRRPTSCTPTGQPARWPGENAAGPEVSCHEISGPSNRRGHSRDAPWPCWDPTPNSSKQGRPAMARRLPRRACRAHRHRDERDVAHRRGRTSARLPGKADHGLLVQRGPTCAASERPRDARPRSSPSPLCARAWRGHAGPTIAHGGRTLGRAGRPWCTRHAGTRTPTMDSA